MYIEETNTNQSNIDSMAITFYKVFHFLFSVALFFLCWLYFRYESFSVINITTAFRYDIYIGVLFAVLLYFLSKTYNTYLLGYVKIRNLVSAQLLSQFFSTAIIFCMVSVAWYKFKSPIVFILMIILDTLFDCFWSWSANSLFYKYNPQKNAIVLYGNKAAKSFDFDITGKPVERLISIKNEVFCSEDNIYEILEVLKQYDVFFAVGISAECVRILSLYCKEEKKDGFFEPDIEEIIFQNAYHIQSFHEPIFVLKGTQKKLDYLLVKRIFDIFASIFGIVVLSPLMLTIAIAIKVYDKGPVIYKQKRFTMDSREFTVLKFRSMCTDAEANGAVRSSGENDSRITPVGRIMRSARLDELPQLFNILKGEMTFVGPRPERLENVEEYSKTVPEFKLRLQVKAGLTGYAQVYGKYNTSPEQKLKFDLIYINNMCVLTDIKLIFATIGILFTKESTEGFTVAEGHFQKLSANTEDEEKQA